MAEDDAAAAPEDGEDRLGASELEQLAEIGADWVWQTDAQHRFVRFSGGVETATGLKPARAAGKSWFDFFSDTARRDRKYEMHVDDLKALRPFRDFVYEIAKPTESCRYVSVSGFPRFDKDGAFAGYCGSGRNVTETVETIEELRETRRALALRESRKKLVHDAEGGRSHAERLMAALNAMHDAFCYYDGNDRLVLFNDAMVDMYAGLEDVIRPGVSFETMMETALERGVILTGGADPRAVLAEVLARRREQAQSETVLAFGNGRFCMHREIRSEDGGTIGICTDVTDLKRREDELARAKSRSENLLSDLERTIDSMSMGIVLVDAELRAETINRAFYEIWKVTPQDVAPGSHFRALMDINRHKGIYDVPDAEWEGYVASRLGEIRAGDVAAREFRRADGCTMIYSVTALSGGKRLVSYYDVSEMKQREADLAEALEQAKLAAAVIDGVRDPIFVKDADLNFVVANEAFSRILGRTPEEIIGKSDRDFFAGEQADAFAVPERELLETGTPYEFTEDAELSGGRTRVVRKSRVRTDSGKDYIAGFLFDITEMKQRESEARDARAQLELVVDSLSAGVLIYDRDDRLVVANRKMRDPLPAISEVMQPGSAMRDILSAAHANGYFRRSGDDALDALYEADREAWLAGYAAKYHAPQATYERQHSDGRWYKVFDTRTPEGFFVGVRVDISENKQREEELEQARRKAILADRAKSEFLANMSHEIRTPMNGVLGMAELMSKTELDTKQRTFIDIIVKSGNALLTIINDILDFSKIDAGQLVLDPAPFNLAEAIEDVATLVSTRAKEKDLELIVRVQPGLNRGFVGDVGRLRQIITNLLGNAVKFTDKGHVLVDVSGERGGEASRLKISVTDTGIGIPADKLALIFDKFSQVDASSTRRHEGTGLGLAITSRLVEMMGGEVGVESREGEGSTFWFTVELPHAALEVAERVTPMDITGARVLIVDDNEVNRAILSEQMASWRFDACAVESGAVGIEVLTAAAGQGVQVDCVVLDYQMPGMTGAEMARLVRATPQIRDVPIVMLTSVDQSLAQAQFRDLLIDAQLIKPVRSSLLLETLVTTIQKGRGRGAGAAAPTPPAHAAEPIPVAGPAAPSPAPEPPPPAVVAKPAPKVEGGLDILVAEDNEVNQLVFTQILSETARRFHIVGNGELAVAACRQMAPRMILMDVSMPTMNGLEATAAIRAHEAQAGGHVPIVGVTAHALKGDRERCIEAGMDDYLSKPISPDALLRKVATWLDEAGEEGRRAG